MTVQFRARSVEREYGLGPEAPLVRGPGAARVIRPERLLVRMYGTEVAYVSLDGPTVRKTDGRSGTWGKAQWFCHNGQRPPEWVREILLADGVTVDPW